MRYLGKAFTAVAVVAAIAVPGLASSGSGGVSKPATPRWVLHVQRFRGGLDGTVRDSLRFAKTNRSQLRSGPVSVRHESNGGLKNVQVNADSSPPLPQNEEAVAYSLDNPKTAVVASNDYVNGGLFIGTTHDGGKTWRSWFQASQLVQTRDFCSGGDPSVVYSRRDHAFYASQLCFFRAHPESAMEVIKSTDGGDTWTPGRYSTQVISNILSDGSVDESVFYDKEQLAVDNTPSSPFYGRLYTTYVKFHILPDGSSDYCPGQVGYTDNTDPNGDGDLTDATWTNGPIMPDTPGAGGLGTSANQGVQPIVDDQGGLDVSFMEEECNTSIDHAIYFKRSTDGGSSFGPLVQIDKPGQWEDNPDPGDLLPNKNARVPASTSAPIVFNFKNHALQFVVQNNIDRTTSGADISYTESHDYGTTWEDMRFVAVTKSGAPAPQDQFFPWMAVDTKGVTHIIWLDNRLDPNNVLIDTFRVVTKHTSSFSDNRRISTESWNPNAGFFASGAFFGDYIGVAAGPKVEYPMWTDGRNTLPSPHGQTDVFTVPNH
jgi:hypothetical protein